MTRERIKDPLDDPDFAICGVCGGEHDCGLGYAPDGKNKILWACRECLDIAPHVYGVVPVKATFYSTEARDYAGRRGGEYLEKLGKFSLADLTEAEYREFLDILFKERAYELRRLYAGHVAPF